jgi:hypothetical protein
LDRAKALIGDGVNAKHELPQQAVAADRILTNVSLY